MIAAGEQTIDVTAARLLAVLGEPDSLAAVLPGSAEGTLPVAGDPASFDFTLRPEIALGTVPIRTRWTRLPSTNPGTLRFDVDGRTDEHVVRLRVDVGVESVGATAAHLRWTVEGMFSGTLGSVGQRVVAAIVGQQAKLVLRALSRVAS